MKVRNKSFLLLATEILESLLKKRKKKKEDKRKKKLSKAD